MKTIHFLNNQSDTSAQANSDQSQQQLQRIDIPKTIVLGGQTFSIADTPELKSLLELTRKDAGIVERNKLYPQFEKLKRDFDRLDQVEIIAQNGNAGEIQALLNKSELKIAGLLEDFKTQFQPLLNSAETTANRELASYREELLKTHEGKVIPEMVVGDTKEALDAAIEPATSAFSRLAGVYGIKPAEQQMTESVATAAPATAAPAAAPQQAAPAATPVTESSPAAATAAPAVQTVVLPSSPENTELNTSEIPDIKNMSADKFAASREDLKKNLQALYGDATLG